MTSRLVKSIERETPELADEVVCGGPGDLEGHPVVKLDLTKDEQPCPEEENFNPNKENFGVSWDA